MVRATVFGVAIGLGLGLAGVATGQDGEREAVQIRLGITEGDTMTYAFSTQLSVAQEGAASGGGEDADGEQPGPMGELAALPEQRQSYDFAARFTVSEVEDDGAMEVRMVVLSYAASWTDGEAAGTVSANLDTLRRQAEEAPDEIAERDPVTRAMATLGRAVGVITVDADGTVSGARGFEGFERTVRSMQGVDDRAIGPFTNIGVLETVRPVFEGEGVIQESWRPGEGWQSSRSAALANLGALEFTYDWELRSVAAGVAVMEGEAEVELLVPQSRDARTPRVTLREGSESVRTLWDAEDGGLISRSSEQRNELMFNLEGADRAVRLRQTTNSESSIERIDDAD